jgi:hypothetical protein
MVVGAKPRCFGMRRESVKFWTRHTTRSQETSSYDGRELEDHVVKKKSYVDQRRRESSFEVGNFVYLKESPMRGLRHFTV